MNNYICSRKDIDLLPDEIAPWKLPRDKHATISVATQFYGYSKCMGIRHNKSV